MQSSPHAQGRNETKSGVQHLVERMGYSSKHDQIHDKASHCSPSKSYKMKKNTGKELRGKQGHCLTHWPECSPSHPSLPIVPSSEHYFGWIKMQCPQMCLIPFVTIPPNIWHSFTGNLKRYDELQIGLDSLVLSGQSKSMQRCLMKIDFYHTLQ